jgi:hypothetical protein
VAEALRVCKEKSQRAEESVERVAEENPELQIIKVQP